VQLEKSWGPPVDTAVNLRGQGLMGLVNLGHPRTPELVAIRLADPEPRARSAAARCAVGWGDATLGRALLLLRIGAGEPDPEVLADCFDGLIRLAAADRVVGALTGEDQRSEAAALALGSARVAEAVPALIDWFSRLSEPSTRKVALVSIGLTRSPAALEFLLDRLRDDRLTARAALDALAVFLPDPAARPRIVDAARKAGLEVTEGP
jgi:HEAT repeat protein